MILKWINSIFLGQIITSEIKINKKKSVQSNILIFGITNFQIWPIAYVNRLTHFHLSMFLLSIYLLNIFMKVVKN